MITIRELQHFYPSRRVQKIASDHLDRNCAESVLELINKVQLPATKSHEQAILQRLFVEDIIHRHLPKSMTELDTARTWVEDNFTRLWASSR